MNLNDYFKNKEHEFKQFLPKKGYYIIRLDGKAFHTFCKGMKKPYDKDFIKWMDITAQKLCENIQCVKMAYVQSDEISLILTDLDSEKTQLWFDGNIQKIVSISSSLCSVFFNKLIPIDKEAFFDSRVFKLDNLEDVSKYLCWRQSDAIKNSITMLSLHYYSHNEIHKKNSLDKLELIKLKGDDYNNHDQGFRQGRVILAKEKESVFINPKTQQEGLITKTFWEIEQAPDFKNTELKNLLRK